MAQRQRRHSCFILDARMVIEIDVEVYPISGLVKGGWLVTVDALYFQNAEEVFCHGVVITVPTNCRKSRSSWLPIFKRLILC